VDDRFPDVRQEAVWALGNVKNDSVVKTIILSYGDSESRVRAAAVASLRGFRGPEVLNTLKHAFEKDSSYLVTSAALQSLSSVDSSNQVSYIDNALQMNSYNDIIRSTALRSVSMMRSDYAVDILTKYTEYGIDQNLRIQAIDLLAKQWKERDDVMYTILRLARDRNFAVKRSAIRSLSGIGDVRIINALKKNAEQEKDKRILKEIQSAVEKIQKIKKSND
jgi:HEAT repeat protein